MMPKIVSRILFGVLITCLLITLIVPKSPMAPYAITGVIAVIAMLVVFSAMELIYVFVKTTPSSTWKPGNSDQAEGRLHRSDPDEED